MSEPAPTRYHAMDGIRSVAMLLGIVLHGCLAFVQIEIEQWPVRDIYNSFASDSIVGLIHAFRMPLFFIVAGFFTQLTYEKYGLRRFVYKRSRRLVVPYVLGLLTIIPILHVSSMWARLEQEHNPATFSHFKDRLFEYVGTGEVIDRIASSHLWFLYYVIIIVAVHTLVLRWGDTRFPSNDVARRLRRRFDQVLRRRFIAVLAIPSALLMLPMGTWFIGTPKASYGSFPESFVPELTYLAFYGLFFVFGVFLYLRVDVLGRFESDAWTTLAIGWVANSAAAGLMLGFEERTNLSTVTWGLAKGASIYLYAVGTWALCYGFLGIFLRYFDHPSARWREWSAASYWIYLTHMPVVIVLQALVHDLEIPWSLKLGFVCVVTALSLFYPYRYFVSKTWIGRLLSG